MVTQNTVEIHPNYRPLYLPFSNRTPFQQFTEMPKNRADYLGKISKASSVLNFKLIDRCVSITALSGYRVSCILLTVFENFILRIPCTHWSFSIQVPELLHDQIGQIQTVSFLEISWKIHSTYYWNSPVSKEYHTVIYQHFCFLFK